MKDEELLDLARQCLSISNKSTFKDEEIRMWIQSAISDMERQNIDVAGNINDALIQGAIIMYVKSYFGMCDQNEKKLALDCYNRIVQQLSLSSKYIKED